MACRKRHGKWLLPIPSHIYGLNLLLCPQTPNKNVEALMQCGAAALEGLVSQRSYLDQPAKLFVLLPLPLQPPAAHLTGEWLWFRLSHHFYCYLPII